MGIWNAPVCAYRYVRIHRYLNILVSFACSVIANDLVSVKDNLIISTLNDLSFVLHMCHIYDSIVS